MIIQRRVFMEKPKVKPKKKNYSNYKISAKFTAWAAPIVEASYGFTSDEDILEYILDNKLADEILPNIDKGRQPIGPSGPIASFQTKNGKWVSSSKEYKEMKRIIFGQPAIEEEKPVTKEVSYNISKTYNA